MAPAQGRQAWRSRRRGACARSDRRPSSAPGLPGPAVDDGSGGRRCRGAPPARVRRRSALDRSTGRARAVGQHQPGVRRAPRTAGASACGAEHVAAVDRHDERHAGVGAADGVAGWDGVVRVHQVEGERAPDARQRAPQPRRRPRAPARIAPGPGRGQVAQVVDPEAVELRSTAADPRPPDSGQVRTSAAPPATAPAGAGPEPGSQLRPRWRPGPGGGPRSPAVGSCARGKYSATTRTFIASCRCTARVRWDRGRSGTDAGRGTRAPRRWLPPGRRRTPIRRRPCRTGVASTTPSVQPPLGGDRRPMASRPQPARSGGNGSSAPKVTA